MKKKLLTIIIPAYNVEKYLEECLDSLVNQTEQDHFVVIVDDGSTDNTPELCDDYVKMYPELFYCIHQENKGLGAARNIGMNYVKTPYFTFLDSDDWWDLDYIKKIKKTLKQFRTEEIDIIYTLPKIYDSMTNVYLDWNDKQLFYDIFFSKNRIVSANVDTRLFFLEYSACRKIFRTDFAKKINFKFEENVKWEDVYPHFYSTYYAEKCLGIDEIGFIYRINTSSQITSSTGKERLDIIHTFAKTISFMIKEKMGSVERNAIISRMISFLNWCITESNRDIRAILTKKIAILFRMMPKRYWKDFFMSNYSKKEKLFVIMIQIPILRRCYSDYLIKSYMKKWYVKVKRAIKHG